MSYKEIDKSDGFLLNNPGHRSTATLVWYILLEANWSDAEIHISDCDRKISLDFDIVDATSSRIANDIEKAEKMAESLTRFSKEYKKAVAYYIPKKIVLIKNQIAEISALLRNSDTLKDERNKKVKYYEEEIKRLEKLLKILKKDGKQTKQK